MFVILVYMNNKFIKISEASKMLGVSIDTLRRWDENGIFLSNQERNGLHREYAVESVEKHIKNNLYKRAVKWLNTKKSLELPKFIYCQNSSIFQARLSQLYLALNELEKTEKIFSLIGAIVGEIGNNSFDHNIGNWPDVPGIFFGYNIDKRIVVLADRGQGILKTLKRVKPILKNDSEALETAFTKVLSGRAPENRGNGLKFVRKVIMDYPLNLFFQTGLAELKLEGEYVSLNIKISKKPINGCLAIITF